MSDSDPNPDPNPNPNPNLTLNPNPTGSEGATVEEIDAGLSLEGYTTSTGTPWPAKNDGRVVVRALLRGGLRPESRDHRIMTYAAQWEAKMMSPRVMTWRSFLNYLVNVATILWSLSLAAFSSKTRFFFNSDKGLVNT